MPADRPSPNPDTTLSLTLAPIVSATPGIVAVRIATSAPPGEIHLEAVGDDEVFVGEVFGDSPGGVTARIAVPVAGDYLVTARSASGASGSTPVRVIPGPAVRFRTIGSVDPRGGAPEMELTLRVVLEDGLGNAIDPHRIRCAVGDPETELASAVVGHEARFVIRGTVGFVPVTLADRDSPVVTHLRVAFPSAWLRLPVAVEAGTRFSGGLMLEPTDPPAKVTVFFDPYAVAVSRVEARSDGLTITTGRDAIEVSSREPIPVVPGQPVVEIEWTCLGPGNACFEVRNAPRTAVRPVWEACLPQKEFDRRKICVNLMGPDTIDADDWDQLKDKIEANVRAIYSDPLNVGKCCPFLDAEVHFATLTPTELQQITAGLPNGAVTNQADFKTVWRRHLGNKYAQRELCINLLFIDMDWGRKCGHTLVGYMHPRVRRGFGVLKLSCLRGPDGTFSDPGNVVPHEIGHALGLQHAGHDAGDLMHQPRPHGTRLTLFDCMTIETWSRRYWPFDPPYGVPPNPPVTLIR
ncbi:MAG: hypothetical protein FJ206_05720 [Gemmatimonadetes bacterium]|nr:hypothetical protein [Gemmatimonadota bacterium]